MAFGIAGGDATLVSAAQDAFLSGLTVGCLVVAGVCFAADVVGLIALPGRHFHRPDQPLGVGAGVAVPDVALEDA